MEFKLDKKVSYKGSLKNIPSDYEYWKTRSHIERIAAVEFLRISYYGKVTPRLQRVSRIIKRSQS